MLCIICHSPQIERKQVNEEIHRNADIIYVPIEVLVCTHCGERYYDRKTMQYLERMKNKLQQQLIQLKEIGKVMTLEDELVLE